VKLLAPAERGKKKGRKGDGLFLIAHEGGGKK